MTTKSNPRLSSPVAITRNEPSTASTLHGLEDTISKCLTTPPFSQQFLPQSAKHDLPTPPADDDTEMYDQCTSHISLEPPCHYRLISFDPPIYALTAEEYNRIYEAHTTTNPMNNTISGHDEEALWPFLHGVGGSNLAQNSFFSCQDYDHSAMAPRYRGLTTVCAEASHLSENLTRSRASSSASEMSSAASSSTHYSNGTSSTSGQASHHPTVKRGPSYTHKRTNDLVQCSQLVSSVTPKDILQPCAGASRKRSSRDAEDDLSGDDLSTNSDHWVFPPPRFEKPSVNLRAFRIQPAQYASISDIVVYGEKGLTARVMTIARRAAFAVQARKRERQGRGLDYNVFVVIDPFEKFEENHPHLVAVTSLGVTQNKIDFPERERDEMQFLTRASPISANGNVWLGNASDSPALPCLFAPETDASNTGLNGRDSGISLSNADKDENRFREMLALAKKANPERFEISIDTQESSSQLGPQEFSFLSHLLDSNKFIKDSEDGDAKYPLRVCEVDFSVQGLSPKVDSLENYLSALMHIIEFIHEQSVEKGRRILIHCGDGYTESSILALSYIMHDRQCSLPEAYLILQNDCCRSFFVYQADIRLLQRIEQRIRSHRMNKILQATGMDRASLVRAKSAARNEEKMQLDLERQRYPWFYSPRFEGSFPSRILPFLYLGNLNHAANATMLRDLGITHVLSVGENASLPARRQAMHQAVAQENEEMGFEVLYLSNLYDDGIDSLTRHVDRCLEFIEDARLNRGKVLVHCRVGVSRSATITMAYVMKHLDLPVIPAYLLVRARRLSTIVQPNLRFLYELLQFEGKLRGKRSVGWSWLAREVACLNSLYYIV